MRFSPKTEEEINTSNLIEKGEYPFLIFDAIDYISKSSQKEMIKLFVRIWDINGHERTICDYLGEDMAYKLRHFSEATGLLDKYNTGELKPSDCVNKQGHLKLDIQKGKAKGDGTFYGDSNTIKDYIVGEVKPKQPLSFDKDMPNDDVPF